MKKPLTFLLKFSVTAGILAYIFAHVPFSEVMAVAVTARLRWIAIAFLLIFISMYIAAYEMRVLTQGQDMNLSLHQILKINLATRFYGLFLPGTLAGGVIRWYKLSGEDRKAVEAFLSILANRFLDTVAVLTVGFLFWTGAARFNFYVCTGCILLVLVYAGIFLCMHSKVKSVFLNRMAQINSHIPFVFLRNKIDTLLLSLKGAAFSHASAALLLTLALFRNLISCAAFYCFTLSLGMNLHFSQAAWVSSLSVIIGMLPVSFFGLGFREGTFIVLLRPYGVPSEVAVALSFLVIFKVIVIGVLGGLLEAGSFLFSLRSRSIMKERLIT